MTNNEEIKQTLFTGKFIVYPVGYYLHVSGKRSHATANSVSLCIYMCISCIVCVTRGTTAKYFPLNLLTSLTGF